MPFPVGSHEIVWNYTRNSTATRETTDWFYSALRCCMKGFFKKHHPGCTLLAKFCPTVCRNLTTHICFIDISRQCIRVVHYGTTIFSKHWEDPPSRRSNDIYYPPRSRDVITSACHTVSGPRCACIQTTNCKTTRARYICKRLWVSCLERCTLNWYRNQKNVGSFYPLLHYPVVKLSGR